MILKFLFKIYLLIIISASINCKSIKKRQAYQQQYQQPYYNNHHQSAIGNQEYGPQQQYQPISEYQQAQLEHINQQLKHQFIGPQTQNYYNHDRVQHYQQRNYNKDQLNHALNGRFINQHHGQHPIHFEEHNFNNEENYKQNRRHINEDVQQQEILVKEDIKKEVTESAVNTEKQEAITPEKDNKTNGPEKIDDLTQKNEEVLKKELDNENEISEENLKETNKREEDCESKEYIAAKHEVEDKKENQEEDCESKEYIAAKHEIEENKAKEEEDCESKEYIAAQQTLQENEENKEDCESKEYLEAKHAEQNENTEKEIITQPKEFLGVEATSSTNIDETQTVSSNDKVEEMHQDLDPHSIPTSGDNTRNERTIIGRLHELDDPRILIDNFRHKLKTARNNIEQVEIMNRRKAHPRVFVYDPNLPAIPSTYPTRFQPAYEPIHHNIEDYQINDPLPQNKYRHSMFEGLKGKSANAKQSDDSFSDSSEEKKAEDNKTTGLTDENNAEETEEPKEEQSQLQEKAMRFSHERNTHPEEIRQLLHVRDEINRIRHIMQVLKEHELKQKYGPKFQNSRNLTEAEEKEMKDFVDKLKKEGKISTSPLKPQNNENEGIQSNPGEVPNTKQLIEEIGKLKQSIKHFAKNVGVNKDDSTEANLEKLEGLIVEQKREIENLQKLVGDLLPPTDFPSPASSAIIKHPELEKHHLHHELQTLQETLNDLLKKEEKTLKTAKNVAGKFRARASENETKNPKDASEKEIGTLVKILHTVQQHPAEDKNAVLAKLEQMEHEIKKLDIQNHRTRQEILLEKLEREVKNLKDVKSSTGDNTDELTEKIRKLEEEIEKHHNKPITVNAKLEELEKQIQHLSKPMGRELDSNIEKELDRLQKQIEDMNTKGNIKPSGRQLEGLLSDILSNAGDNSNEKQVNVPPHSILNGESNQQAPVFQIPYCLQKHPNYAIYQDSSNIVQPGYEQPPIKQQQCNANYNNGPQSISYAYYKYIPHPKPVVIQPIQFQPQKQIYSKPVQQFYQSSKPVVQPVYGPPRPPTYAPTKVYSPQKPVQPIYEAVKPINTVVNQGYAPLSTNQYNAPLAPKGQKPCGHSEEMEEQIKKLNNMLNILNEKMDYGTDPEPEDYEAVYRSKNSKTRTKREIEKINIEQDKQQLIREIRERLADLREQVQTIDEPQPFANTSSDEQSGKRSAYYQTGGYGSKLSLKKKQKFDDLFIKVVKFILHKLEISAPYVVESLFNGDTFTYEQDYDGYNNNGYRSSQKLRSDDGDDFDNFIEDNNEDEVQNKNQNVFGGLLNNFQGFPGLLGFIPNILLKLLSNFSSFLNILKRNKFFKNFLFPGALILVIDGIMALLIWWFSTDDTQNLFDFNVENHVN